MKKVFIAVILAAALLLVACGGPPKGMNKETYDLGCRALEIIQKYNSADISEADAKDRLKSIANSLDNLTLTDSMEDLKNGTLKVTLNTLVLSMTAGNADMINAENDLKKTLGK